MTQKAIVRTSVGIGFVAYLVLGLVPSLVYGGYFGLVLTRSVMTLSDTDPNGARITVGCMACSALFTGMVFLLAAWAIGRHWAKRKGSSDAESEPHPAAERFRSPEAIGVAPTAPVAHDESESQSL